MSEKILAPTGDKVTWGEIKQFIEKTGIRDTDEIDSIDVAWGKLDKLKATFDTDFGWQICL